MLIYSPKNVCVKNSIEKIILCKSVILFFLKYPLVFSYGFLSYFFRTRVNMIDNRNWINKDQEF